MKKSRKNFGPLTAEEGMALLQSDPEWVRKNEEREREFRKQVAFLEENQKPLLVELRSVGWDVNSVWDLVNTSKSYSEAIPILRRHLSLPYHRRVREGIARALTVREARGEAAKDIINELKRSRVDEEREFRWTLANALTVAGDRSLVGEIMALIADDRYRDLREILELAAKRSARIRL